MHKSPEEKRIEKLRNIYNNINILIKEPEKTWYDLLLEEVSQLKYEQYNQIYPLKRICEVIEQFGCDSIIIEYEYVDVDYLDTYSAFYSKLFSEYKNKCIRLHFFGTKVTIHDIIDFPKGIIDSYIGYVILRPTTNYQVSRTVIKSPYNDGIYHYTLCNSNFEVNLSGNSLCINGMPFIQQDTNVNVCAQSSMWMIALYMHQKYSFPRCTPPQISELATKNIDVGGIREGLNPIQMTTAFKEMGYNTCYFPLLAPEIENPSTEMSPIEVGDRIKKIVKISEIIYGYIESEIPVLLGISYRNNENEPPRRHSVIVIGHDYIIRNEFYQEKSSSLYWINNFIIHDDVRGPYLKMSILESNKEPVEGFSPFSLENNLLYMIVPTPPEVQMRIDDILAHNKILFNNYKDYLNKFIMLSEIQEPNNALFKDDDFDGLITRTYLIRSNDFKSKLPEDMDPEIKMLYRSMRFPKYIWVTEISTYNLINKPDPNDRKRIGEIIIDSTTSRFSYLSSYLAIHFKGRLFIKDSTAAVFSKGFSFHFNTNDKPYSHLIRKTQSGELTKLAS